MAINPIQLNPIQLTGGAAREPIDAADVAALRASGVLIEDPRRERPRYFDGRFLAARDLIRDQQYFLTREADLGRAAGSGVANGLFVTPGTTPHSLEVSAGQGITPAGELVLLPGTLTINLADIPVAEQLSAKFGLGRIPVPPLRSRTGLYVLALRPVEFTANPIGAYPTTLTGPRTVEDGDIIEATALVLVPWQDDGGADALAARRGRAARTIFTGDGKISVSANVLPLAMIALQSNTIVWIDEAMVRRELGADRGDLPGLGFAPRALRVAHLLQHQTHLADVVAQMNGRSFAAATQFPALPPAGPVPPGTIDTRDFTQRYFPAEVDVDFSIIPDDELPALVEEALALPPIDFLGSEAALDLTAVLVLAPVPRNEWRAVLARLESRVRTLRPAAANLVAQRKPLEILQRLRLPLPLPVLDVTNPADAEWARLARLPSLWYVRRRNLAYRDDLAGTPVAVSGRDEVVIEQALRRRLDGLGLAPTLDKVLASTTTQAAPRIINLLAAPRIAESPALTAATLGALTAKSSGASSLDHATVLAVAAEMTAPGVGDGLTRLERSNATGVDKTALLEIASGDEWRVLDAKAAVVAGPRPPLIATRPTLVQPVKVTPALTPTVKPPGQKVTTLGQTVTTPSEKATTTPGEKATAPGQKIVAGADPALKDTSTRPTRLSGSAAVTHKPPAKTQVRKKKPGKTAPARKTRK